MHTEYGMSFIKRNFNHDGNILYSKRTFEPLKIQKFSKFKNENEVDDQVYQIEVFKCPKKEEPIYLIVVIAHMKAVLFSRF